MSETFSESTILPYGRPDERGRFQRIVLRSLAILGIVVAASRLLQAWLLTYQFVIPISIASRTRLTTLGGPMNLWWPPAVCIGYVVFAVLLFSASLQLLLRRPKAFKRMRWCELLALTFLIALHLSRAPALAGSLGFSRALVVYSFSQAFGELIFPLLVVLLFSLPDEDLA